MRFFSMKPSSPLTKEREMLVIYSYKGNGRTRHDLKMSQEASAERNKQKWIVRRKRAN